MNGQDHDDQPHSHQPKSEVGAPMEPPRARKGSTKGGWIHEPEVKAPSTTRCLVPTGHSWVTWVWLANQRSSKSKYVKAIIAWDAWVYPWHFLVIDRATPRYNFLSKEALLLLEKVASCSKGCQGSPLDRPGRWTRTTSKTKAAATKSAVWLGLAASSWAAGREAW